MKLRTKRTARSIPIRRRVRFVRSASKIEQPYAILNATGPRVNLMEAPPGFEPGNKGFADLCLATWLWRRINKKRGLRFLPVFIGAEDEIRTRDVHLGKVTLYH